MCESHFKAVVLWEAFACIIILTIAGESRHSGSECSDVAAEDYRRRVAYLHHMAINTATTQEHTLLD
jgi:ABC-type iron transport system FetAB ATPase subunit